MNYIKFLKETVYGEEGASLECLKSILSDMHILVLVRRERGCGLCSSL